MAAGNCVVSMGGVVERSDAERCETGAHAKGKACVSSRAPLPCSCALFSLRRSPCAACAIAECPACERLLSSPVVDTDRILVHTSSRLKYRADSQVRRGNWYAGD
jgi:hypothetical protein